MTLPIRVETDRSLQNRYKLDIQYSALYIDLDDTLILRGKVNIDALKLVFECINRCIPVILITRHRGDLDFTLKKHRLTGLFDEVIRVNPFQKKSELIYRDDSILLDDSFSERWDVQNKCGILTFDCSMLEALISSHPHDKKRNKL